MPPALRITVCHKSQAGAAKIGKTAPISGDNLVKGSPPVISRYNPELPESAQSSGPFSTHILR